MDIDGKKERKLQKLEERYEEHNAVIKLLENCQSVESDMRESAREAALFILKRDGQWEPYWWNNCAGKPRYTFDMTTPIVDQICGEISQAAFDIRISPAGGDATKETALTFDGMVRNIENMSGATEIYNAAARGMVTSGFDAWRVVQKYVDDDSFDQDLAIEKVWNAIDRVWFDPSAELQDKSDSRYGFVLHPVGVDEYDARWPDGSRMSVSDGRDGEAYYDKDETILCGELLYSKIEFRQLAMMSNGQTHEVTEDYESIRDELASIGVTEVKRRKRKVSKWCSRFFDAGGWLEDERETVFRNIPLVPVYGNYSVFENKTIFFGAVEKLLDPQRVMNYSMSREIEEGALAPRAKYWMTQKQAQGFEDTLSTLNTNSDPVQFYNPDPEAPPPAQQGGAQVNPGLRTISESMRQIIGQAAGMFAANMGDNPGLQSGVAIQQLQSKGDTGTVKFFKSMELAIAATGRLLVDAIPRIYDTARQVRVLYEDDTYDMADINQQVIDGQTGKVVTMNDLAVGKYDVVCTAGPAFQNRQSETMAAIIEIAKVDPSVIQLGGDLLLNNIPTPAAKQLAERRRAQMITQGIIPQSQLTEEEKAEMAQKQQAEQPADPAMVLAMAEMKKAEAEALNAQNNQMKLQIEAAKLELDKVKFQNESIVSTAEAEASITKSATEQQLTQSKIKTEDAKVALEAEKLNLEREALRLEQERLRLDREVAAAKFQAEQQAEQARLEQARLSSEERKAEMAERQAERDKPKPKRARFNRATGSIEADYDSGN